MAVPHVQVHQVGEDQPGLSAAETIPVTAFTVLDSPSRSPSVCSATVRPLPQNRSSVLPIPRTVMPAPDTRSKQRGRGRRHREVLAVVGTHKVTGLSHERPGDHPPDRVPVAVAAGDLAQPVQPGQVEHAGVAGDLEHRVGRRVEDRAPRGQVLGAQFFDHHRARRRVVAQETPPGLGLDRAGEFGGESAGEDPVGPGGDQPGDLPVAGGGVLARRGGGHATEGHGGPRGGRHPPHPVENSQPGRLQVGKAQASHGPRHVAERVGPGVPVPAGVGRLARPAGVEHHHHRPTQPAAAHLRASHPTTRPLRTATPSPRSSSAWRAGSGAPSRPSALTTRHHGHRLGGGGQQVADRPGRAGVTGRGGHLTVADHLALTEAGQDFQHGLLEVGRPRHSKPISGGFRTGGLPCRPAPAGCSCGGRAPGRDRP